MQSMEDKKNNRTKEFTQVTAFQKGTIMIALSCNVVDMQFTREYPNIWCLSMWLPDGSARAAHGSGGNCHVHLTTCVSSSPGTLYV